LALQQTSVQKGGRACPLEATMKKQINNKAKRTNRPFIFFLSCPIV